MIRVDRFIFVGSGRVVALEWHFDTPRLGGVVKSQFVGNLRLDYLDGRNWKLTAPFSFVDKDGTVHTVPAGFITDFASIPRWLWSILPPTGDYGPAAVIHDWEVRSGKIPRDKADDIFEQGLKVLNVNAVKRWVLVRGVHIGTWWNNRG